jgi:hypothetical protein
VRTTDQLCGDCHATGITPTAGGTAGWRTIQAWQDEATADDGRADDPAETSEQNHAAAAADRAAAALTRAQARLDAAGKTPHDGQRDEQLARWHADDQAEQRAAARADSNDQAEWDERGVA